MAIVKMKRLCVVAMQEDRPALLEQLQSLGCVEIGQVNKDRTQPDLLTLKTPDATALNQARNEYQAGELALEILKGYNTEKTSFLAPRPVVSQSELFNQGAMDSAFAIITKVNEAKAEMGALEGEKTALEAKVLALKPWEVVDLPLETGASANITVQFGVLPVEVDANVLTGTLRAATELADLQVVKEMPEGKYAILTSYNPDLDKAMDVVKSNGWARTNFRGQTGTARENIAQMEGRIGEINREILAKEADIRGAVTGIKDIQRFLDGKKQIIAREEAQSRLVDTEKAFYLEGWVEADEWPKVEPILTSFSAGWSLEEPKEEEIPDVPVKLKNSKLTRSMSIVTEMYSLPAYNGIDPNPLMAPFFILFYGMMMADMGYGLLMILATQMVLSKSNPKGGMRDFCELFRMLGYSTFAWGAVTGGFFGNFLEAFLKTLNPSSTFTWFWPALFTPLDDTISILVGSMVLGAIHVLTGMAISFNKKAKDGKFMDGVMDEGSWWLLFVGIGVGATSGVWLVAYAGVAALICTQGRNNKGIGKIVGGVASLYDITGYFGDILSYARLMALMLAGSVIAKVFNDLGVITGNPIAFLAISISGNTLNFLLNVLGCFVHTLRLQCLEFFGKFYMDGGKAFKPLAVDTTFVDVEGQNA